MWEKLTSRVLFYAFIGEIVFTFINIFLAAVTLIVATNASSGAPITYFYVMLAFSVLNVLLLSWLSALYYVGTMEERTTPKRIKTALVIRLIFRISNLGYAITLLLAEYLAGGTSGVEGNGYDNFLKVFAILIIVVEGIIALYSFWKIAWMKENPERYSYAAPLGEPHAVKKRSQHQRDVYEEKAEEKDPEVLPNEKKQVEQKKSLLPWKKHKKD